MVAEIKKGKYVYYHCTGNRGKCPEPFIREEELAKYFGEALSVLEVEADVLSWIKKSLLSSAQDEQDFHAEILVALDKEYKRLQDRLDALYVDKLDGKIDSETFTRLNLKWRDEQNEIQQKREKHQKADRNYVDAGIQILELASKAKSLYETQPILERRRLLQYLCSNSSWKDSKLTIVFRQPFNLIADMNPAYKNKKAANGTVDGSFEFWLPTIDAKRNPKTHYVDLLVKMYRRRGRNRGISLYDPLPDLTDKLNQN